MGRMSRRPIRIRALRPALLPARERPTPGRPASGFPRPDGSHRRRYRPDAQQPVFAPVPAQHQEAVSLFRPASEVPGQLQDVPKPGPTTGGASASADVSAPLLSPTSDPVSSSTAAEPKAASGDLSQSLQDSGRTLKPEPTPAPESVAEPGSDRAAVAVAPPAREEPPARGLAEPEGQGKDSPKLELSIEKASAAALSQALQTLD